MIAFEYVLVALVAIFFAHQVVAPAARGRPLFPAFRRESRENRQLRQAREQEERACKRLLTEQAQVRAEVAEAEAERLQDERLK